MVTSGAEARPEVRLEAFYHQMAALGGIDQSGDRGLNLSNEGREGLSLSNQQFWREQELPI